MSRTITNYFIYRFFFSLILIVAFSVINIFCFEVPYLNTSSENLLISSVYTDSEIDFNIPSPTKNQLEDIEKLDFVDDTFGYYFTESSVEINDENIRTKILFSDMTDSLDFTMYSSKRLISSSTTNLSNPIYVDYAFAKNNSVTLGDVIVFNGIEFQVGRIYQTNTYYDSAIFAPLVGEQKDYIESALKSYSGAYLKVNDISAADSYLRNYKPLGRLKDRSEFETDEQYQIHYESWNNANYYNEITSFNEKRNELNLKTSNSYYIGIILTVVITFVLFIILSFRKSEKSFANMNHNNAKVFFGLAILLDFVMTLAFGISSPFIAKMFVNEYFYNSIILDMVIASIISSVVLLVCETFYFLIYYKKVITKDSKKQIK